MVKKNARIITGMKNELSVRGSMSFTELKEWCRCNSKYGLTSHQLGNILAKSGHFDKVGMVMVESPAHLYSWLETVWEVRP
jgi:hypothetical protein